MKGEIHYGYDKRKSVGLCDWGRSNCRDTKCFTEYMMLMIARNNKMEELENDLENMNDTAMFSVADLKGRLE